MRQKLKVEKVLTRYQLTEAGCWVWQGAKNKQGYGKLNFHSKYYLAHRFFYENIKGPIPEGLQLDHLCRNPSCVNPNHLEPVTQKENTARGYGISAFYSRRTHCKNGHLYTSPPVVFKSGLAAGRICRICKSRWEKERYYRLKSKKVSV